MALLMLWSACALPGGCALYVNIPRQPDSPARYDPNLPTVAEVMGRSLEAVAQRWPSDGPWLLELPEAASAQTYAIVTAWAPDRIATTADGQAVDGATLSVIGVRVRGTEAEVDLLRPADAGPRQLVTVYLKQRPFEPWRVIRLRPWRLGPDSQTP